MVRLYFLGMNFIIMIFITCVVAWAGNTSQITAGESVKQSNKHRVYPLDRLKETQYNIGVKSVEIKTHKRQTTDPNKIDRTHRKKGEAVSSSSAQDSRIKKEIKIIPLKERSVETPENMDVSGDGKGERRRRSYPTDSGGNYTMCRMD